MSNFISFPISATNPFAQDRDLSFLISWYSEDVAGFLLDITTHALLDARGQNATPEMFHAVAGTAIARARQHDAIPDALCQIAMPRFDFIEARWRWGVDGARPFFGLDEVCCHGKAGELYLRFDHGAAAIPYGDPTKPWVWRRRPRSPPPIEPLPWAS